MRKKIVQEHMFPVIPSMLGTKKKPQEGIFLNKTLFLYKNYKNSGSTIIVNKRHFHECSVFK